MGVSKMPLPIPKKKETIILGPEDVVEHKLPYRMQLQKKKDENLRKGLSDEYYMREKWYYNWDRTKIISLMDKTYLLSYRSQEWNVCHFDISKKKFSNSQDIPNPEQPDIDFFYTDNAFYASYTNKYDAFYLNEMVKFDSPAFEITDSSFLSFTDHGHFGDHPICSKMFYFNGKIRGITTYGSANGWKIWTFDRKTKELTSYRCAIRCNLCHSLKVFTINGETYLFIHSKQELSELCRITDGGGDLLKLTTLSTFDLRFASQAIVFNAGDYIFIFDINKDCHWNIHKFNLECNTIEMSLFSGKLDQYYKNLDIYNHNGRFYLYGVLGRDFFMRELLVSPRYDLCSWMRDLKPYIGDLNIRDIKIPATHNSGAYNEFFLYFGRNSCQEYDIGQQLEAGIRCFDIRILYYKNQILMHHGGHIMSGQVFETALKQIKMFLAANRNEFIVLSFGQIFYMNELAFIQANELIKNYLLNNTFKKNGDNIRLWMDKKTPFKSLVRNYEDSSNQVVLYCRTTELNPLIRLNPNLYWASDDSIMSSTYNQSYNTIDAHDYFKLAKDLQKYLTKEIQKRQLPAATMQYLDVYIYNKNLFRKFKTMASVARFCFHDILASQPNDVLKRINCVAFDYVNDQTSKQIIDLNLLTH